MRLNWFILLFFLTLALQAQEQASIDYSRLPDKVYMHFDRNLYSVGDTIWTKAYVFHRNNHALSDNSFSLHIQMLSQEGEEVSSYKMLIVDGMGYGQIPIYGTIEPGFYQIIAHTGYMKNFSEQFYYKKTIEIVRSSSQASIKVFFDKPSYNAGDTAKVSFQAFDEYHLPVAKQRFQYALSCNGKVTNKRWIKCYEDGTATSLIPIEAGSKNNPPELNLTYFEKETDQEPLTSKLYVPMQQDKLMVQFFPEGGSFVQGLSAKVAFEATDVFGKSVDIKGVILENGEVKQEVSTLHDGMGVFLLFPEKTNYSFKITEPAGIDSVFPLPTVVSNGYTISYLRQDDQKLYLSVSHNYPEVKNVALWVSQYDKLLRIFDLKVQGARMFTLPKSAFPEGIVTFTITDDKNIPQAERLIYIAPEDKNIRISTQENIYSQRKKVEVKLSVENPDTTAYLSVAVVDSVMATSPWLENDNIKSYALLRSELRGKISDINQYLKQDNITEQNRNLLLMTHGWRRYAWIYKKQYRDSMKVMNFNYVDGQVLRFNKPVPKAEITAMVKGDLFSASSLTTDEDGRFRLELNFEDRDKQEILFQGKSAKGRKNVNVILQNNDTLLFNKIVKRNKDNLKSLLYSANRYIIPEEEEEEEKPFMSYETKMLRELVVYGTRNNRPTSDEVIYEIAKNNAVASMKGEDLIGDFQFSEYVMQVAPHRVQYDSDRDALFVKSVGEDSAISGDEDAGAYIYLNSTQYSRYTIDLNFLSKDDIIEIVVLDPEQAFAMYGTEGEYGIIMVRTKPIDFSRRNTLNHNMTIFDGFIKSKEFYKPVYETKKQDSLVVVDNRITLDWEPFVETDENGEASFEFYTDDISGIKQIVVQGIDANGNLYYQTYDFEVDVLNFLSK